MVASCNRSTSGRKRGELVDAPALRLVLACQRKAGVHRASVKDPRSNVLTNGRTVLETVTRSPANQPHIVEIRMPVDQKITGRSVLVLADTGFSQLRIAKGRETFGKKTIRFHHAFGTDAPVTQIRIEAGAMTVEG